MKKILWQLLLYLQYIISHRIWYKRLFLFTLLWLGNAIYMATEAWVNIGSDKGFLPSGTKPLPEPMLAYHKQESLAYSENNSMGITQEINWKMTYNMTL